MSIKRVSPPKDEVALLEAAQAISGFNLEHIAGRVGFILPKDARREKGWVGQLLERALGATAGSLSMPDFQHLGIELKTIPVNAVGRPQESTFVAVAPLLNLEKEYWHTSAVWQKLAKVLWVPIQADKSIPLEQRKLGAPLLWSPTTEQRLVLKQDWEEIIEQIALGRLEDISSRQGRYLQLRPKAANSRALCAAVGPEGNIIQTLPRGFYLRASFTAEILQQRYIIA